ncbi:hypothetical protein TOPH_06717 [Tolypocladium ophioglossoides CBS 100239]|uniref:Uncharacterized protein n=1 Tax=Tolypocladium ophioglossoides (strain CBS 100239) TaxID=1163406 RepID=A0A0L0N3E2_TOLOC|nr:hypothetical protein TOPH_06717 [Tolypocladium ophioglossoides CBS 100239]
MKITVLEPPFFSTRLTSSGSEAWAKRPDEGESLHDDGRSQGTIRGNTEPDEEIVRAREFRILAVLFFLLPAPAGSRPTSILWRRFGDIRVALLRDLDGGPLKLLIRLTLEFTKTYLGTKDA